MKRSGSRALQPRPGELPLSHNNNNLMKEPHFENICDQLCTRLKDVEDCESTTQLGMQKSLREQPSDAARKYYAAFPALNKGHQSPPQYCLPPPGWCRKPIEKSKQQINMHKVDPGDWTLRSKKLVTGKERRNSYHGQKKNGTSKKRCHSYSKSFESKENLPEWVTHEGVWDLETQDPVREFIRAIALDEGYGTCENTLTDDIRVIARVEMRIKENAVPDWGDDIDLDAEWVLEEEPQPRARSPTEDESYAKFEAKFDSSIEALWSNTPDDECQELPVDFQDLLSSPTDRPPYDKCSLISMSETIWSNDAYGGIAATTPCPSVDVLHDKFKPLKLADENDLPTDEPFSLYSYEDVYDSVPSVASMMRSLTALNHSKSRSSFSEVLPRRPAAHLHPGPFGGVPEAPARPPEPQEDLLSSKRTHFCPIGKGRQETAEAPLPPELYDDGTTFDICSDLDDIEYRRSQSGSMFVESGTEMSERYMEYRGMTWGSADGAAGALSLKFRVRQTEKGVQTERDGGLGGQRWGACDECSRLAGAKKMRASGGGLQSIWSEAGGSAGAGGGWCGACAAREPPAPPPPRPPLAEECSRDWEELLSDISGAHARYAAEAADEGSGGAGGEWAGRGGGDRKRRHSATVWCTVGGCQHPHDAPFLLCCASERPLTR